MIDHVSPAAILLGRFPEYVEGGGKFGQETANHRIPLPYGQVRLRNHQQVNIAVLPRVSPRMAPEENDLPAPTMLTLLSTFLNTYNGDALPITITDFAVRITDMCANLNLLVASMPGATGITPATVADADRKSVV